MKHELDIGNPTICVFSRAFEQRSREQGRKVEARRAIIRWMERSVGYVNTFMLAIGRCKAAWDLVSHASRAWNFLVAL
jgi:hypothetical protein